MRILILGGTGLLGSFLNRYFLKKKKKVFSTGYKKKSKYYLNLFNQNNILKCVSSYYYGLYLFSKLNLDNNLVELI